MPYLDQAGLVARFGQEEIVRLADRDDDEVIDADTVTAALAGASAEIDAYIGTRYAVPLNPTPDIIANLCGDIARYKLSDENPLDEVTNRYNNAIRLLKDMSAGRAAIPSETPASSAGDVLVSHTEDDRIFSRDSLAGF